MKAAAEKDRATVLEASRRMGFLTGDESNVKHSPFLFLKKYFSASSSEFVLLYFL